MSFLSIHNHQERIVYEVIMANAPRFPGISGSPELLADVACIALNSLSPRYIRHDVDMHFFTSNTERALNQVAVRKAVEAAFERIEHSQDLRAG